MGNIYRESERWIRFAKVHRAKWAVLVAYIVTYFLVLTLGFVAQRWEWLFFGGQLGALFNLVFCLGGQVLFLFTFIPLFHGSYHVWRRELEKLFGTRINAGRLHFYNFAVGRKPVEELARIRDVQIEKENLNREMTTAERKLSSAKTDLEVSQLKLAIYELSGKFRPNSSEANRIERAMRRTTDVGALKRLLEELTTLEPHSEVPNATPVARDKIAELEATFRAEEHAGGQDAEATRLFTAAGQATDRKQKRKLLVEAIARLKAENKKTREREERFAAHKRTQAPSS